METGLRILFLSALAALSGCQSFRNWTEQRQERREERQEESREQAAQAASEETEQAPPRVIEPEVERRKVTVPKIDSENVELGGVFGALSIEDFGTNAVYGVTAAYHVTEDFFFQAEAGRSEAGKTSFETLGGNVQLLVGDERRFKYYNLALGYNFLPGEVFLGRGRAMTSSFYLLGGIGSVDFAGDQKFAVSFGAGFRVLPTDWLAIHIRMQDRVFDSDLLGESKLTNNLEANIGLTVFF
ncbi:MAG TPA: outer membrane beta-barrel domain-containing protein [Steroidobacteraceae bacterium]|jgi:outer membrane beta-barrel protein|nr:outer membrane beta-barrel domain-containing protein [Steroidobacteraceae bacterium]